MMTLKRLEKIGQHALQLPFGVGHPHLQSLQESWAPYLRFLYLCVKTFKPGIVLECGVNYGTCTGHMAYGANDNFTAVIGIDRKSTPEALHMQSVFPNICELYLGDTTDPGIFEQVRKTVDSGVFGRIGLIFLDSTHDGITPRQEFELYRPLFADECIVAVDDLLGPLHLMEKMQEFWEWLPGEKQEMHYLHPVPDTHIGLIDQPGFGVSIVKQGM